MNHGEEFSANQTLAAAGSVSLVRKGKWLKKMAKHTVDGRNPASQLLW